MSVNPSDYDLLDECREERNALEAERDTLRAERDEMAKTIRDYGGNGAAALLELIHLRRERDAARAERDRTEAALQGFCRWLRGLSSTGQVVDAALVDREVADLGLWRTEPTDAGSGEEQNDG